MGLLCAAIVLPATAASAKPASTRARRPGPLVLHTILHRSKVTPNVALTYGGGKVQQKINKNYVIFWEPNKLQDGSSATVSAAYNSTIQQYFKDVSGSGLYNNNTQYYQILHGIKKNIVNKSKLAGSWVDTAAYPSGGCTDPTTGINCVTDAQLRAEVTHAMAVNGWTAGATKMFYVFTSKGEGSYFNLAGYAFQAYCAYHYNFGKTIYANMPYGATPISGYPNGVCVTASQFPNDRDADITINVTSHEQMEAVTDPYPFTGWNSSTGEIGDLCAWNFGSVGLDGGKANEQMNGHFYLLQQEWSNAHNGCVQTGP
jgi:hypothetical protein